MSAPPAIEPMAGVPSPNGVRIPIIVAGEVCIPAWVNNLETFRRWARSDEFPNRGEICYLNGTLWVDPNMEQVFTHNLVKTIFTVVLGGLVEFARLGYFFSDRMLLSHPAAGLSTEPDALFVAWETMRSGRIRLVPGAREGFVELEGTPDMALEVVSATSVHKDTIDLRELYWRAGVPEYWLVDARGPAPILEVLRHTPDGYVASAAEGGWLPSAVFGQAFRLTQQTDPLGHPRYTLTMRP